MMRRFPAFCLACLLLFCPAGTADTFKPFRNGLLVSVIQEPPVLTSRQAIEKLVEDADRYKTETLFVQIYRSGQAWFPTRIADDAPYQTALKNIGEDPFALLIKAAHKKGIRVHAWLNTLSLGANQNAPLLKKYGPEILTRNTEPKAFIEDYRIDDQYFLEPGEPRVLEETLNMVEEILSAYPELDGILFDYIRYPDTKPAYGHTAANENLFKKWTGLSEASENHPVWLGWKRHQVSQFLAKLFAKCRELRPDLEVSATGCAPYSRAYHEAFQDWPSWLDRDIVDSVIFMNYSPDPEEYAGFIAGARPKVTDFKKVHIGVPAYKLTGSPETFSRLYETCRTSGGGACVVFHYGSLIENPDLEQPMLADNR